MVARQVTLGAVGALLMGVLWAPAADAYIDGGTASMIFQMLIAGGVPLPEALGAAAKIHISRPFQRVMASAQRAVEGGHPLSEELARHRYLMGETLVTMVKLGEHSGGLDESCGHAREFYRRAITRTQSTLADLLVPSGVFVCGSITLLTWLAAFGSFIAIGDAIITDM